MYIKHIHNRVLMELEFFLLHLHPLTSTHTWLQGILVNSNNTPNWLQGIIKKNKYTSNELADNTNRLIVTSKNL